MNAFDVLRPPNPGYRRLVGELELPILLIIGDTPVVSPEIAAEISSINSHVQIKQIPKAGHGLLGARDGVDAHSFQTVSIVT